VDVYHHPFLTLLLDWYEQSAFLSEKEPFGSNLVGVSLRARASLFALEENNICCCGWEWYFNSPVFQDITLKTDVAAL